MLTDIWIFCLLSPVPSRGLSQIAGEYKILFTAVSSSGAVIAPVFSESITVSIGPPHTLVINNGPVGGTLAGEPMPAMPDVLILDQVNFQLPTLQFPILTF
jgi:hypothetical protein